MPEPGRPVEFEVVDHGEGVGGEAVPPEVVGSESVRPSVAPLVEGHAPEVVGHLRRQGGQDGPAEAGGVGQDEVRPRPSQVVEGDPPPRRP